MNIDSTSMESIKLISEILNNFGTFIAGVSALCGILIWKGKIRWEKRHVQVLESLKLLAKARSSYREWMGYSYFPFFIIDSENFSCPSLEVRKNQANIVNDSFTSLEQQLFSVDLFGGKSGVYSSYATEFKKAFGVLVCELDDALDNKDRKLAYNVDTLPPQLASKLDDLEGQLRKLI
ncbi:hypothetical protein [Vibrio parahaemolyticus]|uniref:hypothetical protein n=1 Tax=Vibrio parahaemolyticus TaxID=670 RepID=UPI0015DF1BCA|nr:hypothetical protein [Vibrio parahaemolyticus]MDG2599548.1 hypothetical protein [Vibrio parahaemolyticus]HCG8770201.1 hypothetical protein [Vibrio parahaemolyticus]HCH0814758.1 hypothetical protein [Vibrio parahaemolyticus]